MFWLKNPAANAYNYFGAIGGAIGGAKLAQLRFLYAINLKTDELIFITPESLSELLESNDKIADKYKQEENKGDMNIMFSYLKEFNE